MGSMTDGIEPLVDYSAAQSIAERFAAFKAAIPDPDTTSTSGSQSGIAGFLDEMAPFAAAQLRVEIDALEDVLLGTGFNDVAYGSYTAVAADATANQTDIVTGITGLVLANCAVSIFRAGTNVTADAVITEPVDGTIRVADGGATYVLTAGDVINWMARDPS